MVEYQALKKMIADELSVLALSSRFDGLKLCRLGSSPMAAFSTRSVESF